MSSGDKQRGVTNDSDPYNKGPRDADDDASPFPNTSTPWEGGWGWTTRLGYGSAPEGNELEGTGESLWEEGLYSLLIVAGAVLFVFPEPATSMLGALLLLAGAAGWLVDALK